LVEQHRLSGNVIFVDHLELMPIAYEISTVIVSSSIEPEAFGRVSVEAQSMEKPIVASNIGGSNETIINDKTGFLFKAGDSKNLSEKLKEVLNLSELTLNGIGAEGRKNIIAKFNVEKMCNTTYSEYKKLINALEDFLERGTYPIFLAKDTTFSRKVAESMNTSFDIMFAL